MKIFLLLPYLGCTSPSGEVESQPLPRTGVYVNVAMGDGFGCAVDSNGNLVCWGLNDVGQADPPQGSFSLLTLGSDYGCASSAIGEWSCWGNMDRFSEAPEGWRKFPALDAGWVHMCGLNTGGRAQCWGEDKSGDTLAPEGTFAEIHAGGAISCGKDVAGILACWGWVVGGDTPSVAVSEFDVGHGYICANYADSGSMTCRGFGKDSDDRSPPDEEVQQFSCGTYTACGITLAGELVCWQAEMDPERDLGSELSQVAVSEKEACALDRYGALHCWGNNNYGQTDPP